MINHFGYNPEHKLESALISIVVPVYNEEEGIQRCYQILTEHLQKLGCDYEIVFSDNGSTDQTDFILRQIAQADTKVKYVRLSRNFGYQINITVGMAYASGDAMIVIDADLQDPPELIAEFLKHWQEGYDIVYGDRLKRTGEPALRVFLTMNARRLISWLSDENLPPHSSDFRLITRQVRDTFLQMPESNRYVRSMIHALGFRSIGVPYERRGRQFDEQQKRLWGTSIISLVTMTLDAIFSSSLKPLRVFSLFGIFIVGISIVMAFGYLWLRLIDQTVPRGFTVQTLISLLHLGVTSTGIGILGEYVGRIYRESKHRPLWIVNYTMNVEREVPPIFSPLNLMTGIKRKQETP